jgi:hypothetical protein
MKRSRRIWDRAGGRNLVPGRKNFDLPKRPGQTETPCSNKPHASSPLYPLFRLDSLRQDANPVESYSCAYARSKANRITLLQKMGGGGVHLKFHFTFRTRSRQVPQNVHLHKNGEGSDPTMVIGKRNALRQYDQTDSRSGTGPGNRRTDAGSKRGNGCLRQARFAKHGDSEARRTVGSVA